jgi:hypothetical protein
VTGEGEAKRFDVAPVPFTALSRPIARRDEGSASNVTAAAERAEELLLLMKKHFS